MQRALFLVLAVSTVFCDLSAFAQSRSAAYGDSIYNPGNLRARDSALKVKIGDRAPDFTLPSVNGERISLHQFQGNKNVVISFVPAAWTPVCSDQWPGYNIIQELFDSAEATLLGITVDNIPTLYAWTKEMGDLWFPVLSDFWPHGAVADKFGVLRTDGTAERAIFIVDKERSICYIDVHDINKRPKIEVLVEELKRLK